MEKLNTQRNYKGLHTDSSYKDQPKETYTFALNTVVESIEGDSNFVSNEESNIECISLPEGYKIIGKEYMTNGEIAIFSVNSSLGLSEIGLFKECTYTTFVNTNLNFNIENQIDAVYRLRRGCERTIYFTDDLNKPRIFNFDKTEDFKDKEGNWELGKFNLFKTYETIPNFSSFEIGAGGNLKPGSYNFAIQYLDSDLNPTEWITTSETIIIYNDSHTSLNYEDIKGSDSVETFYQQFGETNKSITVNLNNLDLNFPLYRLAIIEANSGSGIVNDVIETKNISTSINSFTYTGSNGLTKTTQEDIAFFNNIIERASHIEQLENRLLFANTKGANVDFCGLQKSASKIVSNFTIKKITLNSTSIASNNKRPQKNTEDVGYQPREIYSFGIEYIFEDNTVSPVYHIPGRSSSANSNMSTDNVLETSKYTNINSCNGKDYWGTDSEGNSLENQSVRHHRFPSRQEAGVGFVKKEQSSSIAFSQILLDISGALNQNFEGTALFLTLTYNLSGTPISENISVDISSYNEEFGLQNIVVATQNSISGLISDIVFTETSTTTSGLIFNGSVDAQNINTGNSVYTVDIFGIEFSNIELPTGFSKSIIGYNIVRNDRDENNKTILDSACVLPLIKDVKPGVNKFIAHAYTNPRPQGNSKYYNEGFAFVNPEFKFRDKELQFDEIINEGSFVVKERKFGPTTIQDVQPGTSFDPELHKKNQSDGDGFDLKINPRYNILEHEFTEGLASKAINKISYVNTLSYVTAQSDPGKQIYNLSADNKIAICELDITIPNSVLDAKNSYVLLKKNLTNPYENFRSLPYYKETKNPIYFGSNNISSVTTYTGDCYISSMDYQSSFQYDIRTRKRDTKRGTLNFIIGGLAVIGGAVLTGFGAVPLGVAVIGFGASQIATGLKKEKLSKVYGELYEQGLSETLSDVDADAAFDFNQEDDQIQWFSDTASSLWFESQVNIAWRKGSTQLTDFLPSPQDFIRDELQSYLIEKLTILDENNEGGRFFQGFPKPEIYEISRDYLRRNREKFNFHLPPEFDCCSDCQEEFPNRVAFSQQSFQEELTDNYRTFLPNNYRDIEGETGSITNLFRIQNNLYIHTQEGLWHLPQNIQERVTDSVVSFIGTGDYFSIPPRKIVDSDNGNSAGTNYKWGSLKTPYGVFFVCDIQNTIFLFNGEKLTPISNKGMYSWFKENLKFTNTSIINNPSNSLGQGFVTAYDSRKERILITKINETSNLYKDNWTMSYSLKNNSWTSWHTYLPYIYLTTPDNLYSVQQNNIWKHNQKGKYLSFYGSKAKFIVEYISISSALVTRVWNDLKIQAWSSRYDEASKEFIEERFKTFNKLLLYNTRQSSGIIDLITKEDDSSNYLLQQITDTSENEILIDRNEKDWTVNELRDLRVDYEVPLFNSSITKNDSINYIDKVVNINSLDVNKSWEQLESFRDKFLVIRLIFDSFEDIKINLNYSIESENMSSR